VSRDERALAAGLNDAGIPPVLARGELEIVGRLANASNGTFLVRARLGDEHALAVYKPRQGEAPLWDFPDGTLCAREVAAYVVARSLGWPNVPPTVLRDGPFGVGSVQRFVRFDPTEHALTLVGGFPEEFRGIALFDLVVNNADRKAGHCLLGEDGAIHVIDHGVCFSPEPKLRTVLWDFAGQAVPGTARDELSALAVEIGGGRLHDELSSLLDEEELAALTDRAETTARLERFPEPDVDRRPFPWPPI
jgi:hypothetical protein